MGWPSSLFPAICCPARDTPGMTPRTILAVIGVICAIASLVTHAAILLPVAVIFTAVAVLL